MNFINSSDTILLYIVDRNKEVLISTQLVEKVWVSIFDPSEEFGI